MEVGDTLYPYIHGRTSARTSSLHSPSAPPCRRNRARTNSNRPSVSPASHKERNHAWLVNRWLVFLFYVLCPPRGQIIFQFPIYHYKYIPTPPPPAFSFNPPSRLSIIFSNACPYRTWPPSSLATHLHQPTSAGHPPRSSTDPSQPPPLPPSHRRPPHVPGIRYVHLPFSP